PSSTAIPPTAQPTEQPTEQPTNPPPTATTAPTLTTAPSATPLPTTAPTEQPTEVPTEAPTESPTESPTTLAVGSVSSAASSGGTGERGSGLDAAEVEFLSAQSPNRAEVRAIDWMAELWRWTGPVVVALFVVVGALLGLTEMASARRWRLPSVIAWVTAKPAPQNSRDQSR
ncbi:MAG: hypothetical protein ACT4QE_04095, partial [Anaerolineales bacterium]